jgi:predicted dehydrogenase
MWCRRGNTDQPAQIVEGQFAGCYLAAVEEFGDAIRQQRQPAITAADGLRNVEVIAALYESARAQRPVVLES